MLYAALDGSAACTVSSCDWFHETACATPTSADASTRRASGGSSTPNPPSPTLDASPAAVGRCSTSATATSRPSAAHSARDSSTARRELPPSSKKLASTLTDSAPSRSTPAIASRAADSDALRGPTTDPPAHADDASDGDANDLDRFGPRTEVDLRLGDAYASGVVVLAPEHEACFNTDVKSRLADLERAVSTHPALAVAPKEGAKLPRATVLGDDLEATVSFAAAPAPYLLLVADENSGGGYRQLSHDGYRLTCCVRPRNVS